MVLPPVPGRGGLGRPAPFWHVHPAFPLHPASPLLEFSSTLLSQTPYLFLRPLGDPPERDIAESVYGTTPDRGRRDKDTDGVGPGRGGSGPSERPEGSASVGQRIPGRDPLGLRPHGGPHRSDGGLGRLPCPLRHRDNPLRAHVDRTILRDAPCLSVQSRS